MFKPKYSQSSVQQYQFATLHSPACACGKFHLFCDACFCQYSNTARNFANERKVCITISVWQWSNEQVNRTAYLRMVIRLIKKKKKKKSKFIQRSTICIVLQLLVFMMKCVIWRSFPVNLRYVNSKQTYSVALSAKLLVKAAPYSKFWCGYLCWLVDIYIATANSLICMW